MVIWSMAFEQFSLGPGLQSLTPRYINSGLVQNPISPTPYVSPSKKDYEILFQPLFDEYFNPPPRVVSPDPVVVSAPRAVDPAGFLRQLPLIKMYHLLVLHQKIMKFNLKSFIKDWICKDKSEWLKFNNRNFSLDSRKEFKKRLTEIRIKEIECPEGLDFEEFGALPNGIALQNLDQFCHVSYEQDDRRFVSQAWNRLFRIKEQVVREYVMELMSSFTYRDHIEELDEADTMVFQLGGENRSMTMRQFIKALGRHSKKEKVTMDDLFLLHSIDGGVSVDVPWHVAKFLCDKAKGSKRKSPIVGADLIGNIASYYGLMTLGSLMNITLGPETSSMSVAELVDLSICRYNGMGIGEMVAEIPEVVGDDDVGDRKAEIRGVGRHPNMSNDNRLRAIDEMLGEIVNDVDDLTYVVSRMSEQYDQLYGEFGQWRTEQERKSTSKLAHLALISPEIVEACVDDDDTDDDDDYDDDVYVDDCVDIEEDEGEIDLDISKIVDISLREKLVESYLLIEKVKLLSLSHYYNFSHILLLNIHVMDLIAPLEEADVPSFSDDSILRGIESDCDSGEDTTSINALPLDDSMILSEYESFTFDDEPVMVEVNVFDEINTSELSYPGIGENVVLDEEEDTFTFTTRSFLPFVTYPEVLLTSYSTRSEDKVFKPGIFDNVLKRKSSLTLKIFDPSSIAPPFIRTNSLVWGRIRPSEFLHPHFYPP
ncbi:hypothetical protein Tco_0511545 [Tanacetum coccineum]